MGKHAGRATSLGIALAIPVLSAVLAFPGTAQAGPSATLNGTCDATLQNGKGGNGLSLDAGAPLNAPNRLTVGLDSKAKQADGKRPLLTVPVGDLARGLGVDDVPVADRLVANACPAAQAAANDLGNTTQSLLGAAKRTPPGGQPQPQPQPRPQPDPPGPGTNPGQPGQPGQPGAAVPAPGGRLNPVPIGGPDDLASISGVFTGAAMLPANLAQAPMVTRIVPGQLPSGSVPPTVDEKKSGSAQALPAANLPERLPLLLAVLALAVVAAALVRAWLRGSRT
ncbi:hypothetical protein ATK36_3455 [Amycolatopsis sulphurea]|uniref:Collagen triple helix repeat protein n=1 Tax=Amycolatopsis sulphurea TaxID=76022 RepID=A0A2A9FD20_9PSEU|nr:hypothetical protein [Amycolatopsis sulphurea]PFG48370.1 hypothetical protein ATK36_3455 [Amycolatopsis sulphurea]